MRIPITLFCMVLTCALAGTPAMAAPQKFVIAISTPYGTLSQQTTQKYADLLQERLGKDYDVQFFHSEQLGKDQDLMQKIKIGTVHLTIMVSEMPTYVEEFAFWDMPFIIKDRKHLLKVEEAILWPILAKAAEKKGYTIVSMWENGFRQITNDSRPIVKPEDLKGIKLRVPRSAWRVDMFKTYGANPTPMAFGEVFVGLQTGVLDGQENPLNHCWANKMQEVQKYLSLSNHVYSPAFLLGWTKQLEKFPPEVRDILKKTAEELRPNVYKEGEASDAELIEKFKAAGTQVNTVDYDSFVKASQPVYQKFAEKIPGGLDMVNKAVELSKK